jgi:SAM-dependent methyltransferase
MPEIKKSVEKVLVCLDCGGALGFNAAAEELKCLSCGHPVSFVDHKPAFTSVPEKIQVTEFRERGEGKGTPWRQANWGFLEAQIDALPPNALVLDVGSGRGDFAQLIQQRSSMALDIYPYPEVDIVCDLTQVSPFREECFDAVVLMNVLEHVFDTRAFLDELVKILRPGGKLLVAIPFLLKEHQEPFDFVRFTQFSLRRWGEECGLVVESLEGYYDPMFLVEQGSRNLKHMVFPELSKLSNYLARGLLSIAEVFTSGVGALVGNGYTSLPDNEQSPAPIGYHVVYRKEK